jgi:diguanylate cyclase (GGDEF)-like protein
LHGHRIVYPLVGALLSLGAPLGLIAVRAIAAGHVSLGGVLSDLVGDRVTYSYLAASTMIVFVIAGVVTGRTADDLEAGGSTDALTRLANRREFDAHLAVELKRSARYGSPLSLLLLDVDRLKLINDRHGHAAGDLALRTVADVLLASRRRTDLAARWGGDEFVLLAPGIDAASATALAERIRGSLSGDSTSRTFPLTVSIGVTDTTLAGDATAAAMQTAADAALYEAKASGRDRVRVSSPPDVQQLHAHADGASARPTPE